MKWLKNTYDPTRHDAKERAIRWPGDTLAEAWTRKQAFLEGKIIGEPMATKHTADLATLRRLHMVGVYEAGEG